MNRESYDRVTSVLSAFSGIDKIPKNILDEASHRGSRVHALCQGLLNKIEIKDAEDYFLYEGYILSFKKWMIGKTFLPHPGRAYDDQLMITGEIDGLCKHENKLLIYDIKTSIRESVCWKYQGCLYAHLHRDHGIMNQVFVKLDKNGNEPKEYFYDYNENIDVSLKTIELYRIFYEKSSRSNGIKSWIFDCD